MYNSKEKFFNGNLNFLHEMLNKDPESYKSDFDAILLQYTHTMKVIHLDPNLDRMDLLTLLELINFLSHSCVHYPYEATLFAESVESVLRNQATRLDPDLRMAFCKALVVLRNRKTVLDCAALEIFFDLIKIRDKRLRKFICGSVVSHLRKVKNERKDHKVIAELHCYLFSRLMDSRSVVARAALLVLVEAFRKKLLNPTKIANAIADCCFHVVTRIQVMAMKFFLGSSKDEEGLDDETDTSDEEGKMEQKTIREVTVGFRAAKKTRKKVKIFEKTKKIMAKEKKSKKCLDSKLCNWIAIQSLFDPQSFADRLFGLLESRTNEKFEIRLLQMALCARIIGAHKLQTLGFYSYLYRYLQPRQREVTRLLLYAAQACHELVPPDVIEQLVRVIAQNFVTDRNTPEAITVGLNAIREIFTSSPFAATEELLRDLTEYKSYKNKNVSMAARGLVTLFRNINPKLLCRKDRGRPTEATKELVAPVFGSDSTQVAISGAECLPEFVEEINSVEMNGDNDCYSDNNSWEVDRLSDDESDNENKHQDNDRDDGRGRKRVFEKLGENTTDVNSKTILIEKMPEEKADNLALIKRRVHFEESIQYSSIEKAKMVCESRILTQEEFRRIKAYQLKKLVTNSSKKNLEKNLKLDDMRLEEEFNEQTERRSMADGLPRLKDIELFHKKIARHSKEERLASVASGRAGRQEFNKPKKGSHVGRTNRELAKRKNYMMVKRKVRGKNRQRSFRDQQLSLRRYLLRQAGRKC